MGNSPLNATDPLGLRTMISGPQGTPKGVRGYERYVDNVKALVGRDSYRDGQYCETAIVEGVPGRSDYTYGSACGPQPFADSAPSPYQVGGRAAGWAGGCISAAQVWSLILPLGGTTAACIIGGQASLEFGHDFVGDVAPRK